MDIYYIPGDGAPQYEIDAFYVVMLVLTKTDSHYK